MSETSTTDGNDPNKDDTSAGSTTVTDSTTSTDNQPGNGANDANNLDDSSKSDDTTGASDDDTTSTDNNDNSSGDDDTSASQFDADLDDWAEKRGMPKAETDEQRKAYQDLRDEQREFTRSRQADKSSNELSDAMKDAKEEATNDNKSDDDDDEDDPLEKDVKQLKAERDYERTTRLQSEFYATNKVTDEQHKAILEIFKEQTSRAESPEEKARDVEFWSHPARLSTLLTLAKARIAENASSTAADEAAQAERERIERESQANSPGRAASTNGASSENKDINSDQARLERFKARYNKS